MCVWGVEGFPFEVGRLNVYVGQGGAIDSVGVGCRGGGCGGGNGSKWAWGGPEKMVADTTTFENNPHSTPHP